jgi:hypothetical protein
VTTTVAPCGAWAEISVSGSSLSDSSLSGPVQITRYFYLIFLALSLWLLAACGTAAEIETPLASAPSPSPAPTERATVALVTPTTEPTATAVPAAPTPLPPPPTATPPPPPTISQYSLWATFEMAQRQLTVTQTITYVNQTGVTHIELPLLIEPARSNDTFQLHSLLDDEGTALTYRWENEHLIVTLPSPLPPHDYVVLHIAYEVRLPAQEGAFGYTPLQTNLGDWYPMIPPYAPERGWIINPPGRVGEHLAYGRADCEVYLRLVAGEPPPLIAASGYQGTTADGWDYYRLDNARNFAWSVGYYETLTGTVNGVTVTSYAFADHPRPAQAAFEATLQAVALFSDLFAPYPRDNLVFIEADFRDGMEFDGLYFLDRGLYKRYNDSPREYLIPIAVHETAHQWWQGIVGNDPAQEPWLDEALATYSELLFYERHYPYLVDWWWHFRVTRFDTTGPVDSTIYAFDRFRPYVNTVYLRGALMLHDLRQAAGDDLFLAFLQGYTAAGWETEQVTGATFWCLWHEVTGVDSRPFLQRYFADDGFDPGQGCR